MARTNISSEWPAERRMYEKTFYSILRRQTKVYTIPRAQNELGYTTAQGDIHLAYEHSLIDILASEDKPFFRYGVFSHELLHQVFTDFNYHREVLAERTDPYEKQVLSLFFNLVEDPAIEYFAPSVFGGTMLQALRYSIGHIYACSPRLEDSRSAFDQLVAALIQFGDLGLIKGNFTFPEAEEYFVKIAPEFDKMITTPNSKARVRAAEKWMLLTRPIWRKEAELDEMIKKLLSQMSGKTDGGSPMRQPDGDGDKDDENAKRRRAFASAIQKAGNDKNDEGKDPDGGDDEQTDEAPDRNDSENGRSGNKDGEESNGDTDGEQNGTGSKENGTDNNPDGTSSGANGNGENGDEPAKPNDDDEPADVESVLSQFCDDGSFAVMPPIDEGVYDDMRRQIDRELKALEESDKDTLDIPVLIPNIQRRAGYQKISCRNDKEEANENTRKQYKDLLASLNKDIRLLTSSLRTLFRCDNEVYVRTTAGRYNLKRDLAHTTVRVFEKKREKKNISDLAVMLLVDCSGSMAGKKITLARNAAIVLTETFRALDVPVYVMGFTADTSEDVEHRHYVSWANTPDERSTLCRIAAYLNNDDGFSIRYASELLRRKQAEHKIMFVLSDGAPACWRYSTATNGIEDTAMAIRDAQHNASVFGVGIGIYNHEEIKKMYKGAFLNIRDVSELTTALAKQLKILIRRF